MFEDIISGYAAIAVQIKLGALNAIKNEK